MTSRISCSEQCHVFGREGSLEDSLLSMRRLLVSLVWLWMLFPIGAIHAATVDLIGPIELHVASLAEPLNIQLSATNDVYIDIEPFLRNGTLVFPSQTQLIANEITVRVPPFPVPPWPHGLVVVSQFDDSMPFQIEGDVLLRLFPPNDLMTPQTSLRILASRNIYVGSYPAAIPIPAAFLLFATGLASLCLVKRRVD